MSVFPPRPGVPQPGINVNVGPQSMPGVNRGVPGPSYLPPTNVGGMETLAGAMGYGLPTLESSTPFFTSNDFINAAFTAMSWRDESEKLIQENMLVFSSKHLEGSTRGSITNMVTIFKLNELMRKNHGVFIQRARDDPNGPEAQFQNFLGSLGENLISEYDHLVRSGSATAEKLAQQYPTLPEAYSLALREECIYETLFGITSRWNFLGGVVSKGESTGPGTYLDNHAHTRMVASIGVCMGKRCRLHNVWPDSKNELRVGSKVFLVLRRERGEASAPFQLEAVASMTRSYPADADVFYKGIDELVRGHVICVGTVTRRSSAKANPQQQATALGISASTILDAQRAMATLPMLDVQIGM